MPATYTHHLFTKDVYKSLDINIQNKIDYDLCLERVLMLCFFINQN